MSEADDKTRLISLAEAAELYGFSRYYLSNLAKKGRLKAQKVGGAWVTTPKDVDRGSHHTEFTAALLCF